MTTTQDKPETAKAVEFFAVNRKDLVTALKAVKPAVSRGTLPCLQYVTLHARNVTLRVTAFDLDMAITHTVDCDATEMTVCLPYKDLLAMVSGKDGAPTVTIHENGVIECAPFKGKLAPLAVADMAPLPELKPMDTPQAVGFNSVLLSGLRMLQSACSKDETRYVLNGVYFGREAGKFELVATDGRRLHKVDMGAVIETAKPFILPNMAVKALVGLGHVCSGTMEQFQSPWVRFTCGSTVLVSKVVEGSYPNYKQVIPSQTEGRTVDLPCAAMASVLDRAAKFTKGAKSVSVLLTFSADAITLRSEVPDKGEQVESIPCNGSAVDGLAIAYNPSFLRDIMTAGDYEMMTARFTDGEKPAVYTAGAFLAVLVPMRLA